MFIMQRLRGLKKGISDHYIEEIYKVVLEGEGNSRKVLLKDYVN